jgi:hypothetical protein
MARSMIPKSVQRFSEKIMLKQRLTSGTSPIKGCCAGMRQLG